MLFVHIVQNFQNESNQIHLFVKIPFVKFFLNFNRKLLHKNHFIVVKSSTSVIVIVHECIYKVIDDF